MRSGIQPSFRLLKLKRLYPFSPSTPFLYSSRSFSSSSCTSVSDLSNLLKGRIPRPYLLQIQAQVFRVEAHQDNLLATRLIGHCRSHVAIRVFKQLKEPNIFPFNAIIRVFAGEGLLSDAFSLFRGLKQQQLLPNDLTFSFLLKACFKCISSVHVEQIHTHVLKTGFSGDCDASNALLTVYAKALKDLVSARKLFDELPDKNVVSWNSLISGCAQSGRTEEALQLFVLMMKEGLRPEVDTLISVLSACSNIWALQIEKWVVILSEFVEDLNIDHFGCDAINAVLVYLYGKWGKIDKSRERFDAISNDGKRKVLPWNLMITALVQNGCPMGALDIFHLMVRDGNREPNHVTMVSVLSACAHIGDLDLGKWVHNHIMSSGRRGILQSNTVLATALIDMYCKCGNLEGAKEVFDGVTCKDITSFNAMIMGLAMNGEGEEALRLFHSMQGLGLHPNSSTFLAALCACNHSGLPDEGQRIFSEMRLNVSVTPNLEHYACYIDLLSRVGNIEEALKVVETMPFKANNFVWGALLGGCLLHNKGEIAQYASRKLVEVDPGNSAGYVMLANAFAADKQWNDVSVLRWFMRERGVKKQPGHSWISIDGFVYEFLAGSLGHPQIGMITETLGGLVKAIKVP